MVEGSAEVVQGEGMLRRDGCLAFARRFGLRVVTIEDLVGFLDEMEMKGGKKV